MPQRKIPLRKCMGCNEKKPKKELVRVVKSPRVKFLWTSPAANPAAARMYATIRRVW
jgi:predicted RNA-binding protein YlxR (DUF448 family)